MNSKLVLSCCDSFERAVDRNEESKQETVGKIGMEYEWRKNWKNKFYYRISNVAPAFPFSFFMGTREIYWFSGKESREAE